MTLNFSPRPIFPIMSIAPNPSDSVFHSPNRERSGDGAGQIWHYNWVVDESFGYESNGGDATDKPGSREAICNDIVDLLPSDPFGMESSDLTVALAGWMEDLGMGYNHHCDFDYVWLPLDPGISINNFRESADKHHLGISGSNFKDSADKHHPEFMECSSQFEESLLVLDARDDSGTFNIACSFSDQHDDHVYCYQQCPSQNDGTMMCLDAGTCFSLSKMTESTQVAETSSRTAQKNAHEVFSNGDGQPIHDGLFFVLGYLGIPDLLSVERVCKSLYSAIQSDPLLWMSIHIDQPLSARLTDEALLQLAHRAQGRLQCLNLVGCSKITDKALKQVLESNPRMIELSVPGCTRLSVDSLLSCLKLFKYLGMPGIKYLRIGGLYGVTQEHYKELVFLLGIDNSQQQKKREKQFYHKSQTPLSCVFEFPIDIEICPRCQNLRLVYDCPAVSCQGKRSDICRGCTFCIARCVHCGRCITDNEYEETFCLDLLCSTCFKLMIP